MATSSGKCVPGLPLEISGLVERVRKRRFYNNFFWRPIALTMQPRSIDERLPSSNKVSWLPPQVDLVPLSLKIFSLGHNFSTTCHINRFEERFSITHITTWHGLTSVPNQFVERRAIVIRWGCLIAFHAKSVEAVCSYNSRRKIITAWEYQTRVMDYERATFTCDPQGFGSWRIGNQRLRW